jgi:hypothetical protein
MAHSYQSHRLRSQTNNSGGGDGQGKSQQNASMNMQVIVNDIDAKPYHVIGEVR